MWVKFHDGMPEDPDVDALSDGAFRLYVSAICYSQREQTNGVVPLAKLRRLVPHYRPEHKDELTDNPTDHADGPLFAAEGKHIAIRNFAKYQQTADYWAEKRAAEAERKAAWRAAKEQKREAR